MKTELEQKARRYRELARHVTDDTAHAQIIGLAVEYERAAGELGGPPPRLNPAA